MGGRDLMAGAKVFGYLYAVTFETGAIKVGMSRASPQSRIQSHTSAGAQFGVSVFNTQVVKVYTPDVAVRESALCALLLQSAKPTAGREWFKFDSKESAVRFAASVLSHIEAESHAARPSVEQIELADAQSSAAADAILDRISGRFAKREVSESRLCAIRAFLAAFDMPIGGRDESFMVELFYRFEMVVASCGDDMSKLPESADGLYYGDIDYEMAFCAEEASLRGPACRSILEFMRDAPLQASLTKQYGGVL